MTWPCISRLAWYYWREGGAMQETSCAVHTFDCTYAGRSLDGNKRHFYHQVW